MAPADQPTNLYSGGALGGAKALEFPLALDDLSTGEAAGGEIYLNISRWGREVIRRGKPRPQAFGKSQGINARVAATWQAICPPDPRARKPARPAAVDGDLTRQGAQSRFGRLHQALSRSDRADRLSTWPD